MSKLVEVMKENNIIIVEHIDIIWFDNILTTALTMLHLKKLFIGLKSDGFVFGRKPSPYSLILKLYKTHGQVFFKVEKNDAEQDIKIIL